MLLFDCSVFDCLLQAVVSSKADSASTLAAVIQLIFVFMMSFFLFLVVNARNSCHPDKPCHLERSEGSWCTPAKASPAAHRNRTVYFTANRRWLLHALPPQPACDRSSAAPRP